MILFNDILCIFSVEMLENVAGAGLGSWNLRPFSKTLAAQCCSVQRHDQIVSIASVVFPQSKPNIDKPR